MPFCAECGHQLTENAKFCFQCGTKVKKSVDSQEEFRKTVYDGEIHKCPYCGEYMDAFEITCKTCGHEFRGKKGASSVYQLMEKLEEIEKLRPSQTLNFIDIVASHNIVSETDKQKITIIKSFAIPNTKEDLLEFLLLAVSNINTQRYDDYSSLSATERALSDAWEAKFNHAYEKALLVLVDHPEFHKIQNVYERNCSRIEVAKDNSKKRAKRDAWLVFLLFIFTFALLIGILNVLVSFVDGLYSPLKEITNWFARIFAS
jgi:hypothetical protein